MLEIAHSLGITERQKLIAVYGRRLNNASCHGEKKYVFWMIAITFIQIMCFNYRHSA